MFKQAAMKATLVHLLVVLCLVVESNQSPCLPFGSPDSQKSCLLEKLDERSRSVDDTFRHLNSVWSKKDVTIGRTNVKKLVKMNRIKSANCRDGSFAKRLEICDQAKSEGNSNINFYCEYKLNTLAKLCHKEKTSDEARPNDVPVDQATIDFFKSLLKDTGSRKLNWDEMQRIMIGYGDGEGRTEMNRFCQILTCSGKQSGRIGGGSPIFWNGDQLEMKPTWDNAYELCQHFFARFGG